MRVCPNWFSIFLICCVLAGPVSADDYSIHELAVGNQAFACDLYKSLSSRDGNLFFSPHSISTALAMTYAGAKEITEIQMGDVLHFPFGQLVLHPVFGELEKELMSLQVPGELELLTANSLWPHEKFTLQPSFINTVRKYYRSDVFPVNFDEADSARSQINSWVEDKTRDKIKDLIPEGALNAFTRLVLVNAVYFKGSWLNAFNKENTQPLPFHTSNDSEISVPMMSGKMPARYAEFPGLQVLELPYRGSNLVMLIALPSEIDGIAELEKSLSPELFATWSESMQSGDVKVYLPAFKMTGQFELNSTLMSLGMTDAFSATLADFSGMESGGGLYISDVIHKAFVDVNEEGTEAAAATAVIIRTTSVPRPDPVFRADHPFFFMIRDNVTGSILFAGRYSEPVTE